MKKIIALVLSLAMLCFYGCSVSMDKKTETTTNKGTIVDEKNKNNDESNVSNTAPDAKGMGLDLSKYNTESITWGPGNIKDHARPIDPEKLQKKFGELGAKWLLQDEKSICLTFDEGYENGYTGQILDTLKEKNVKAIFFCTYDYIKDNPDLVKRMISEGHIVGNHSYKHKNMTKIDVESARDEVTMLHDYVAQMFGYEMNYFRFPEGAFSEQNLALINDLGYECIFWSFAYADWDRNSPPDKDAAFKRITSSTHDGAIFLLHAVCETNAEILGDVIDNVQEQGYTFTTEI